MKERIITPMVGKTRDGLSLTLPMDSWYGARRFDHLFDVRDFPIPSKWHVEIFEPDALRGVAPLSAEQVLRSLQEPIGSESLAKLAAGRKDAVIIVDDLSRPTPAFAVLPQIISELAAYENGAAAKTGTRAGRSFQGRQSQCFHASADTLSAI
jgi:hypothetical protein